MTHNVAPEVLVQQAKSNIMKFGFLTIALLGTILLAGCTSSKKTSNNHNITNTTPQVLSRQDVEKASNFIDANTELILGNVSKAQSLFENVIAETPDNDAAWFQLSKIYAMQLDMPKAVMAAEKAYGLDENNMYYILNLANMYASDFQTDKSIQMYEKLSSMQPGNLETQIHYADMLLQSQQYDKTLKQLNVVESLTGKNPEIELKKIKIYEVQKKYNKIYDILNALIEEYPKETKYLSLLADYYLKNGEEEKAMECYDKIVKLNPDDPYIHFTLSEYYAKTGDAEKAHDELTKGFASKNMDSKTKIAVLVQKYSPEQLFNQPNEKALELLRILADTHPDDGNAQALLGDYYYFHGNMGMSRQQYYKAINKVQNPSIYNNLIQIEYNLKNYDTIIHLASQAIEYYPITPEFYAFKGIAEYSTQKYQDAIKSMNDGLGLIVNDNNLKITVYTVLGDSYQSLGDSKNCYQAYENVLKLDSNNLYVLNNYSYYLSTSGTNIDKAEQMGAKIVAMKPDDSHYLDTYGWALFKNGKYNEAMTYLTSALKHTTGGDEQTILEHLGDVYWKLDKKIEAIDSWTKAYNVNPQSASEILKRKVNDKTYHE